MKLLSNTVLVKVHEEKDDVSVGGLIMATVEKNDIDYCRATVIQVSDGYTQDGCWIKLVPEVGNEVIISKHGGQELKIKEVDYKLLREPDVLVILDPDEIES